MKTLSISPAGRRYGYKKDLSDHRDFGIGIAPIEHVATTTPLVDLEPWCVTVFDQGDEGSCTANAGCGNQQYLFKKFKGVDVVLSRSDLYYLSRKLDGSLGEGDCGSTGRSSCKAMNQYGVCLDSVMPYQAGDFNTAPTDTQLAAGLTYKSGAYHSLRVVGDIKSCLRSWYPVLIGFNVYESFEGRSIAATGIMPVPDKNSEQILGGHEVLIIGYDDVRGAFKVRNSWGIGWGNRGNFYMPYEVAADPDVLIDSWMQHLGHSW